jgi:hypothetical protein
MGGGHLQPVRLFFQNFLLVSIIFFNNPLIEFFPPKNCCGGGGEDFSGLQIFSGQKKGQKKFPD